MPERLQKILAAAGIHFFETHFNYGWPGAVESALFTVFILAVSGLLTRLGVRLRL